MEFSTEETVQKSYEFLNECEKPACSCIRGVRMCHHTPCIGTVQDMERLLDAGYASSLMLDYWIGRDSISDILSESSGQDMSDRKSSNPFSKDVSYLAPAIKNNEGKVAPFMKHGTCTMLVDNKCSLHDLGLKPVQGKMACCNLERVDSSGEELDERIPILHTWNTQKGKDLIERWKKEVSFAGKEKSEPPKNPFEMIMFMTEVMKAQLGLSEGLEEDPNTVNNMKTHMHEVGY